MQWFRTVLVLSVAAGLFWAGWSFRTGNIGVIEIDLLWLRFPGVAIWWALLVSLILGTGIGALGVGFAWLRQRLLNRRYRATIARLESEVHQLRSLPLAGSVRAEPRASVVRSFFGKG